MPGLSEEERKAAGKPDGKMDEFWYQAEKELLAERADDGGSGSCSRVGGSLEVSERFPLNPQTPRDQWWFHECFAADQFTVRL
jgi:hypothetical protein